MVVARYSRWIFKEGKRNEVFDELDSPFSEIARKTVRLPGVLSLLSKDEPNVGMVISLWNDEDSIKASASGVFASAIDKFKDSLKEPPIVERLTVFTAELTQLIPQDR